MSTIDTELYWSLPSARQFAGDITRSIADCRIVAINLPALPVVGIFEVIKQSMRDAHVDAPVHINILPGMDIGGEIGAALGHGRMTGAMLAHLQLAYKACIVLVDKDPDARGAVESFVSDFAEAIGAADGNTCLIFTTSLERPEQPSLQRVGAVDGMQTITFDGGIKPDEMDAYVGIRMLGRNGPGSTRLLAAIISEFATFDVCFAEQLMLLDETALLNLVAELPRLSDKDGIRWCADGWRSGSYSLITKGTHALRLAFLAEHGAAAEKKMAKQVIARLYWRASLKSLTPWLEEHRAYVMSEFTPGLQVIASRNGGNIPAKINAKGKTFYLLVEEVEYNNIVGMVNCGELSPSTGIARSAFKVCCYAKKVRDEIAHLRPPSAKDILDLIREMDAFLNVPLSPAV